MKKSITCLVLILLVFQSQAWGPTGHRLTGLIAQRYLNAKAKKKLKSILGHETLALASTWMDEVRSDSLYNHMTDWHWVTIETGETYENSKKNPNGDLIMTLERVIAELKSHDLMPQKELENVRLLVHLIGDIHQPLHVGCCDDQGGNKIKVKWFRNDSNLHRIWDSDMIDESKFSFSELADALKLPEDVNRLQQSSVRDWAKESMSFRKQVYDIGDGNLSYRYTYRYFAIANQRLMQAGVRLAGVLNEIYGK